MLALLDEEPCDVTCRGSGYLNQEVADVTLSEFLFPSGVRAHIFVSWLHPFKEQRLVVVGSTKMAVFDDRAEDKLVLYPHKVEWKNRAPVAIKAEAEKVDVPEAEPLKQECAHFIACIQERQTPVTDGQEGLRVLSVLNACQHSLEESHRTPLSPADTAAPDFFVHPTAVVDPGSEIGTGTKIWHFTHIMKGARIGRRCIIGQNVNVDSGTFIGNNVKIQNNVSVYTGCEIEDDVFLGPSCVMTNITNPRSQVNRRTLYEKTYIRRGATIGANATLVCGIDIGRYAFIAAGAVVTKDVPDYALMMGNPARQQGWMSRHGHRLSAPGQDGIMVCPESGCRYRETESGILRCLDLDENTPLPESLAAGTRSYDDFKRNPCNPEEGVT
jgi:UDP-2-acetamido-3-amino-2,3-dideoxy-glucuronate N-acetyltransferase